MAKKALNWITLAVLWIVSYVICSPNFQQVSGFWDDGNLLYPVVAHAHGLIPNVDYVNGYPGFHSLFLYGISFLTDINLMAFRVVTWAIVTLGLSFLYFLALDLMGLCFAILAFVWGLYWTFGVFFTLNPAFVVYAIASFCVFYFYREFKKSEVVSQRFSKRIWWVAAFLCGIGLGFKQSALFNILAFCCLLAWALKPMGNRWLCCLIKSAITVLPLVGFIFLRLISQIDVMPWNGIAVLPWCLAVLFVLSSSAPQKIQISFSELIKYLSVCLISSIAWLAYYLLNGESPLAVIHEIYVRIPALIDRDKSPIEPNYLFLISFGIFAGGVFLLRTQWFQKVIKSRVTNWTVLVVYVAFAATVNLAAYFKPELLSPWASNVYWVSGVLFSAVMIGFIVLSKNQTNAAIKAVFVFVAVSSASGYPYVNNVIFSDGLLALTGCFLVWKVFESLRLSKTLVYIKNLATISIACSFLFVGVVRKIVLDEQRFFDFPNIGYNIRSTPPEFLFTLTGEWLAVHLPENSTVDGYPNFALSFAFANRVVKSKLPNFLGDQKDYDKIVENLESGKGADYFVISPSMYPWRHPYLIDPDRIMIALVKNYVLDGVVKDENDNMIQIYKKR